MTDSAVTAAATAAAAPSPLRISTMTVTGHLGAQPNLSRLFSHCAFIPYWDIAEGILKIEWTDEKKVRHIKGISSDDILHNMTKSQRQFCNQSSLVLRYCLPTGQWKESNIKLFKNGGFQMTGVSSEAMARLALERLLALNGDEARSIWPSPPHVAKFEVRMMNSDYSVGAPIRRDVLYKVLVEEYGLWCNYEPTIYQGVNTKFFWNSAKPVGAPPGICTCPTQCKGDAPGNAIGACKKITISPFRTGSVIVTGAQTVQQLMDAYDFINMVFRTHPEILRPTELATKDATGSTTGLTTTTVTNKRKMHIPTTVTEILTQKIRTSPRGLVKICG